MELMIFFAVVGVIAACLGIYGYFEMRKKKNNSETESGDA